MTVDGFGAAKWRKCAQSQGFGLSGTGPWEEGGGGHTIGGGGGPANRQPGSYMDPYTASERNFEGSLSVRYHIWSQTQWSGM